MAHALPRPGLGPRQGARHALQHRRRHPHGARRGRHAVRQLVGLPRGGLGPQRARVRRPRASATASRSIATRSASWSTRHGERFVDEGADFRNYTYAKYGARRARAAGAVRLAGLRQQGRRTCCATSTASARSPRCEADTLEELVGKLEDVDAEQLPARRCASTTPPCAPTCRSIRPSRTGAAPTGSRCPSRTGPTRSTRRRSRPTSDLRHHLHLRRACASRPQARSLDADRRADPGPLRRRRDWSAACSTSTIPAGTGLTSGAVFGRLAGSQAGQLAASADAAVGATVGSG